MTAAFILAPLPQIIVDIVRGIVNFWMVGLMVAAVGTLLWFIYSVYLRKLWRVRRIANLRLRRMLEENDPENFPR